MIQFMEVFRETFTWIHIGVLAAGCGFIYYNLFSKNKS